MAQTAMHSGNTHERQPNFRHRKKKENRKIERGEFITPGGVNREVNFQNNDFVAKNSRLEVPIKRIFIQRFVYRIAKII